MKQRNMVEMFSQVIDDHNQGQNLLSDPDIFAHALRMSADAIEEGSVDDLNVALEGITLAYGVIYSLENLVRG